MGRRTAQAHAVAQVAGVHPIYFARAFRVHLGDSLGGEDGQNGRDWARRRGGNDQRRGPSRRARNVGRSAG